MLIVSTVGGPLAASCSIFGILFALPTHAKTYKSVPTAAVPASQSHTDARPSRARAPRAATLPAMAESSRLPGSRFEEHPRHADARALCSARTSYGV